MTLTQITEKGIKDGEIVNADINASAAIALSKIATGALPTGITIASGNLVDGTIVNADINASAAIAQSKLALSITNAEVNTNAAINQSKLNTFVNTNGVHRIITGSATKNTLNGNSNLTYNGVTLKNQLAAENGTIAQFELSGQTNNPAFLIKADESDSKITFRAGATTNVYPKIAFDMGTVGDALTILNDGKIGIGLTNPSTLLHLDSGSTPTTIKLDSDTEASIDFDDHGGSPKRYKIGTNISSNDGQFEIKDMTANAERIRIDSGGKTFVRTDTGGDSLAGIRSKANFGLDGSSIDYAHSCYEGQLTHNAGSSAKKGALLSGWDGTIQATAIGQNYDGTGYNLSLATNNNTSDRPTERLRVERTGNVKVLDGDLVIGAAGHGIDFSDTSQASGSSSEVLDDYEEGTFTPVNPSLTVDYSSGHYTKIGRYVIASIRIGIPSNSNANNFVIDGLPFNSRSYSGTYHNGGYLMYSGGSSYGDWAQVLVYDNSDRLQMYNKSGGNIMLTNLDGVQLRIQVHYFTD